MGRLTIFKNIYAGWPLEFRSRLSALRSSQLNFGIIVGSIFLLLNVAFLRLGFDPHHDGLILVNIRLLNDAWINHAQWPFNQYGPGWALIFSGLSSLLPQDYFFLTLRIITLSLYILAGISTYKLALKFLKQSEAGWIFALLFAINPFLSSFNSDMIPWPSAFIMLITPTITLFLIQLSDSDSSHSKLKLSLLGIFVAFAIFTRAQIGFALLICTFFTIYLYQRFSALITYLLGLVGTVLFIGFLLNARGWLSDALHDEFIFGTTYVTGDKSTYPKPLFTFLISLILVLIYLSKKFVLKLRMPSALKFFAIFLIFLIGIGLKIKFRNISSLHELAEIIFRRIWISFLIAAVVVGLIQILRRCFEVFRSDRKLAILIIFSAVGLLQVFPLFDQMHAWWGATPAIILVYLFSLDFRIHWKRFTVLLTSFLFGFVVLNSIVAIAEPRVQLPINGFKQILVSKDQASVLDSTNRFLYTNLNSTQSVLNLCTNANVFFPTRHPRPSSRVFLLWNMFSGDTHVISNLTESRPDQIVTCTSVTNPDFLQSFLELQAAVIKEIPKGYVVTNSYMDSNGVNWRIWKSAR